MGLVQIFHRINNQKKTSKLKNTNDEGDDLMRKKKTIMLIIKTPITNEILHNISKARANAYYDTAQIIINESNASQNTIIQAIDEVIAG